MPINTKQLIELIIQPTLKDLGLYSLAAEQLLVGTCAQESLMGTYVAQVKGPALGIFQMEPATHEDLWNNYIGSLPPLLKSSITQTSYRTSSATLVHDLAYACAMARIHYLRVKAPLPPANDIPALASYWKKYYNTPLGKGKESEFIANWNKYCADYYGGK
jgi:hypothetical protein